VGTPFFWFLHLVGFPLWLWLWWWGWAWLVGSCNASGGGWLVGLLFSFVLAWWGDRVIAKGFSIAKVFS
jgi:hypothetical protein